MVGEGIILTPMPMLRPMLRRAIQREMQAQIQLEFRPTRRSAASRIRGRLLQVGIRIRAWPSPRA